MAMLLGNEAVENYGSAPDDGTGGTDLPTTVRNDRSVFG